MRAAFFRLKREAAEADKQMESMGYITSDPFKLDRVNPNTGKVEQVWGTFGFNPETDFTRLGCWLENDTEPFPAQLPDLITNNDRQHQRLPDRISGTESVTNPDHNSDVGDVPWHTEVELNGILALNQPNSEE